jgi:photosystem II stability/assembly factor-like uncharacterized protein
MSLRLAARLGLLLAVAAVAPPGSAEEPVRKGSPAKSPASAAPAGDAKKEPLSADTFAGLEWRALGPAVTSGRVIDVAVDPRRPSTWFVAAASGGVWKTTNAGTTWKPVFDDQGSYSIGCVTIDPNDSLVVWVGSGENNSQRSVGYGDGVYKSTDGGASWENVGLKESEHVGKIVVDPRNSKVVYVAAQGPLWNAGGDRGLFKTADGGKTWSPSLKISENTGVSDVWLDPRNPDVLYAASYQRRRHVWTLIDGGPESAIYKSVDAGASWKKLEKGLPKGDLGRIGLAVSPANPDVVYALIEASEKKAAGTYRSTDAGGSWEKRDDYVSGGPQYYQELIPDPRDVNRVYSVDVFLKVSEDGGKSWKNAGETDKHVDNHVVWIDPDNTDHLLNGNDGGLYESWDRAQTWAFKANLPLTQFYRVAVDDAKPFYNVYGGTQDNFSLGGPSRTTSASGITNADWFVTQGGDGFVSRADPKDPSIVYAESQYGVLVRFDRRTGESVDIQPQPAAGGDSLRFNWDSPLIISPHLHTRLYFAAQRLFRSDDRGDHWKAISPDLTRQIDRNTLKVMGRVWSVDAVAKNSSTSSYGNIVSLAESPTQEGLLFVGTDDGLVQVSEDAGGTWRKVERVGAVPERTYVSDLEASRHDPGTVYAAFDNHKMGDYKPYVYRSGDRGRTWTAISGDLPARGSVYTVAEDTERRDLLFAGTEFGIYFTIDGGKRWTRLKGALPTIAVRDIAIQEREGDLVIATFGRGFYVLDDITPLRRTTPTLLEQEAAILPGRPAAVYVPATPLGGRDRSFQGSSFFVASNPPFGAVFTYYLKDEIKSRKSLRQEAEKKLADKGADVSYPTWEALLAEDREEAPAVLLTVTDADGNVVRRLTGPATAGFHRVAWDVRYPAANPTETKPAEPLFPWSQPPTGPLAVPGTYSVSLAKRVDGKVAALGAPQTVTAQALGGEGLPASDRAGLLAFQQQVARLQRAAMGAVEAAKETQQRIDRLKKALDDTPKADVKLAEDLRTAENRLKDLQVVLVHETVKSQRNEPTPPGIIDRVQQVVGGSWTATAPPTGTQREAYEIAAKEFAAVLGDLRRLVETDLKSIEDRAEAAGAPWTPGRLPRWEH